MTEVNNTIFIVKNKTNNTFELFDSTDAMEPPINTGGYDDYDSGGLFIKLFLELRKRTQV